MDKEQVFRHLQHQHTSVLLELLESSYEEMNTNQRRVVFGQFAKHLPPAVLDSNRLLEVVKAFQQKSLAGRYYAPFQINSKNFMDIPEETEEWFEHLGDLLENSSKLTEQNEHELAVECFQILNELIDVMESGQEIVFADELGSWMIPGDNQKFVTAYLTSLAAISSPEEFTRQVMPLLRRDSYSSFINQVYPTAMQVANEEQKSCLKSEIKRQKIRISK
jgi:hypothetical protein